jgi:hypothetical protein
VVRAHDARRQPRPHSSLSRPTAGPRSRRAAGVGDVAGERRGGAPGRSRRRSGVTTSAVFALYDARIEIEDDPLVVGPTRHRGLDWVRDWLRDRMAVLASVAGAAHAGGGVAPAVEVRHRIRGKAGPLAQASISFCSRARRAGTSEPGHLASPLGGLPRRGRQYATPTASPNVAGSFSTASMRWAVSAREIE